MLPSNKPTIPAFFHPLTITIDGKFEDATAAILKISTIARKKTMKTTKPLKLMPMKKKTMKTTKPLKLMPMKKKTIVAK